MPTKLERVPKRFWRCGCTIAGRLAGAFRNTGRERIANRVREALSYEKSFSEASNVLLDHLRDKPECRELLEDIDKARNGQDPDEKPSELQELMERHVAAR